MDPNVRHELRRLTAAEDEAMTAARQRAGATAPPAEFGALLAWLARSRSAAAAVEVGSAGGVTGLWLLSALSGRRALTSIDPDPYGHALAVQSFEQAGLSEHARCILGDPGTVLSRLSDAAYDLLVLQLEPGPTLDHLEHGARLLRPEGLLVVRGIARPGDQADASADLLDRLLALEAFDTVVIPFDDGITLSCRREVAADATSADATSTHATSAG